MPDRRLNEDPQKMIRKAHEGWKRDMEVSPLHIAFRKVSDTSSVFILPGREVLTGSSIGPYSFLTSSARSDSTVLHFSADGNFCYEYGRLRLLPASTEKYVNYVNIWIVSRRKALLAFSFLNPF